MVNKELLKKIFSLILLLLTALISTGQNAMEGKEFWLGFLQNNDSEPNVSLIITISSEVNTSGTVSVPLQNWSTNFSVTAGGITNISVPASLAENKNSGMNQNKGIHVSAEEDITVFATNHASFTTDGSYILPEQFLGSDYFIMSYNAYSSWPNNLLIVSVRDNTILEIIPSVPTYNGNPAGVPFTVSLKKGESYLLKSEEGSDITGTQVRGKDKCVPFAVFGGSKISNIPSNCVAADHIFHQMLPLEFWGNAYFIPMVNGLYSYRVMALEDNTKISINSGSPVTLNAGKYFTMENQSNAKHIASDKPVSVAQFLQGANCSGSGDPAMSILAPGDKMYDKLYFSTPNLANINNHYMTIVVKSPYSGMVYHNGVNIGSGFTPFPSFPSYSYKKVEIQPGFHSVRADSGLIVNLFGTGGWNSYFYSASYKGEINQHDFNFDEPVCAGIPVVFTAEGNNLSTYSWDFGDNSSKTGNPAEHNYDLPGVYTVTLVIKKQNGSCFDTIVKTINVPQAPIVKLASDTVICGESSILIHADGKANSFLWSTGDTGSYIVTNKPGIYWLKTSNEICKTVDTVNVRKYPYPRLKLDKEIVLCENIDYVLNAEGEKGLIYKWSTGETDPSIKVKKEGWYWVEASNYCGSVKDSAMVQVKPAPKAGAGADTTILLGTYTTLEASGEGEYSWSPGTGLSCIECPNPVATPQETTTYYLTVKGKNNCISFDSVTVYVDPDLLVYIPDIFSPNGDGTNDRLFVRGKGVKTIHFMVYNRWGEKIFETTDKNEGWDGTFRGQQLPPSVFVYYLDAFLETDQRIIQKGDITLVR